MHPNEGLVRQAYTAQAEGGIDAYVDLLTDDFVLHIPGRSGLAGTVTGRDGMRRHFAEIATLSGGTFQTGIHDVLASDDHAIGLIDATAHRDGVEWSLPRVHVWHVRDGRLAELWLHPVDQTVFDAYWGP